MKNDLYLLRLRNTLWLFHAYKQQIAPGAPDLRGLDRSFAAYLGLSPSYWTRMKGPNPLKNIGDLLARKIERKFHLPVGWLDKDREVSPGMPRQAPTTGDSLDELGFLQAALEIYRARPNEAIDWVHRQRRNTDHGR